MKKNDTKFASVMFFIFLLPTAYFCWMVVGCLIYIVRAFTGLSTGSEAAGGTYALLLLVLFVPLAIGFVILEKDFYRRMQARASLASKNNPN